ncbi:hypothetical protein NS354_10700 [Leucobacter chromiiresistens]|uniref:Uncharacterized protein n=2 Tax=Leucobacter chromiiresistens TaxID=1079994 RepID=A0A147EFM3_9MICO|nr:hypothetical protein NS354_10700 [Leucobacter chromiiresistens]
MSTISPPNTDVVWAEVEHGFYVGSRGGEFLGYIDVEHDTRNVVCDMYSRPVGEFASLAEAMHALETLQPSEEGAASIA